VNVAEKIKTHILMFNNFFFPKTCRVWDNMKKCGRDTHATAENMAHAICMLSNYGWRHIFRIFNTYCLSTEKCNSNAPTCYVYTYKVCLVWNWFRKGVLYYPVTLTRRTDIIIICCMTISVMNEESTGQLWLFNASLCAIFLEYCFNLTYKC